MESIVDEAPSEVVHVEIAVSIFVHSLENTSELLNAKRRLLQNFSLDVSNCLVYVWLMKYLDGLVVFGMRCCQNNKHVFSALEPGRYIRCDLAVTLKSKILGLVL